MLLFQDTRRYSNSIQVDIPKRKSTINHMARAYLTIIILVCIQEMHSKINQVVNTNVSHPHENLPDYFRLAFYLLPPILSFYFLLRSPTNSNIWRQIRISQPVHFCSWSSCHPWDNKMFPSYQARKPPFASAETLFSQGQAATMGPGAGVHNIMDFQKFKR